MLLSFGPYAGHDLHDVPDSYLELLTSLDISPKLREAVTLEIARRHAHRVAASSHAHPPIRCAHCLSAPSWPRCRGSWCCPPGE